MMFLQVHLQGGGGRGGEQVVLVTGGAGFLGQYVVRLLHERATGVREIRVLDTKPFTPAMGRTFVSLLMLVVATTEALSA